MILPVALPFVVVKNRIIEPVDSGIYLKFFIIFQMGIENKSDIRSNAISFMYNAFPIQCSKIASTTSDRIDIGKYFPFLCLKSTYCIFAHYLACQSGSIISRLYQAKVILASCPKKWQEVRVYTVKMITRYFIFIIQIYTGIIPRYLLIRIYNDVFHPLQNK